MPNDSEYVKERLEGIHTNIRIIRHPSSLRSNLVPLFSMWSHHEKSVVIDQKLCFVGGIDLCYGRYDNEHYWLNEPVKGGIHIVISRNEVSWGRLQQCQSQRLYGNSALGKQPCG
jgi:phosphatidylserine/phosphatidylglycerophosphate/cardiolipin synthase-like enzyme